MPSVYRSPYAAADQPLGNTNILGFVGDKSALGENGVKLEELLDGPTSTLLFVETKHSVPWTKPEDLEFTRVEDAKQAIPFDGQGLSFLFVNGGPVSLPQPIDWDYLGKLITREADVSMPSGSPRHMEQLPSAGRPHQKTILLPSPAVLVPLQFGLFVSLAPQQKPEERRIYDLRPFEIEGLTIAKLIKLFRTSPIGAIQVDSFQFACMNEFFKIPPGLQVSKNNVTYMLVSTDPRCAIGWEEINGRILNLKIERQADDRSRTLSLTFDAILGEKMRSLTENAIGQRLAVISYNRVLAAPKIDSTFSSSLVITGAFSEAQLEPLQLALASAQVASATEVATSPPLPGSTHTTNQETSISGTITMNGKPLAEVWIVFLTNAGGRPIAARTDDRGGYVVTDRDVSPGQYQVKITTGTDDYRDADGNLMAGRQETIPARYNQESTLTVEIKGQAGNVLDFNLSSD